MKLILKLKFYVISKDIWGDSNSGIDQRSSVVGYAYLSGICSQSKYSIVEEKGGFSSISVWIKFQNFKLRIFLFKLIILIS